MVYFHSADGRRRRGVTPEYVQLGADFGQKKSVDEMLVQIGEFLQG